jgi:tetratricopeptide (TPR) repeat protein
MKLPLQLLTIFALAAAAVSAQDAPGALAPALSEARALITQGSAKAAIAKLDALNQPSDTRVAHLLGVAYYNAGDYVQAVARLTPVLTQLPKDSAEWREGVQLLGFAHYLLGHLPEAVAYLEQSRAWLADNNELNYSLGLAYIQTRQPDKARDALARLYRVAPDSPSAHLLAAQMMIRLEFEEFAEAELKRALEKDSKLANANYLLSLIALQRAKFDEGVALLKREIEVNPGNAMAYFRLGDAYTRQLKWDEAIVELQKSLWINPYYSGPYLLLGKAYQKKRQFSTAEGMLKRAIQYDPNNKSAHYLLAQVYQQTGRAEDARREFAIAEKLQGSLDGTEK